MLLMDAIRNDTMSEGSQPVSYLDLTHECLDVFTKVSAHWMP